MIKCYLKMPKRFLVLIVLLSTTCVYCVTHLEIVGNYNKGALEPLSSTIKVLEGTTISLTCYYVRNLIPVTSKETVWGQRSKDLRFRNEADLLKLAYVGLPALSNIAEAQSYDINTATKQFTPVRQSDQGLHFCMNLKERLFKVIHIKVLTNLLCNEQFLCVTTGHCINRHYMCDGKADCFDGSDENRGDCGNDPCKDKIQCHDGRCIPTSWCCNKHTDENCDVSVTARPNCCPPLLDPYDPINFYENEKGAETTKTNSSRYFFILMCLISALLSFVLFLFIISKVCGFDGKPTRPRNADATPRTQTNLSDYTNRCEHSQCAVRREFGANTTCLYLSDSNDSQISNNNDMADPLIVVNGPESEISVDQPPPYAEAITCSSSISKSPLEELTEAPPPPYSSATLFLETDGTYNASASDFASNIISSNHGDNQSTVCDTPNTGDISINT